MYIPTSFTLCLRLICNSFVGCFYHGHPGCKMTLMHIRDFMIARGYYYYYFIYYYYANTRAYHKSEFGKFELTSGRGKLEKN